MIASTSWISTRPGRCGGDPCVRDTRIPVWSLVERRRHGLTDEEIIRGLPDLTSEDLAVAWQYAKDHALEIDRSLWLNEACMVEWSGPDDLASTIRQGSQFGLSDQAIREAFDPPLTRDQFDGVLGMQRIDRAI
jgi:uncharacterized protein (DUF433 family)